MQTACMDTMFFQTKTGSFRGGRTMLCILSLFLVLLSQAQLSTAQCVGTAITSVAPLKGSFGTLVTIQGCGFDDVTEVSLGPVDNTVFDPADGGALAITNRSSTYLIVRANEYAVGQCGDVVLFFNDSTPMTSFNSTPWCYESNILISSVSPKTGQYGTRVTLLGSFPPNFGGAQNVAVVTLAGFAASIVSQSSGNIVVQAGDIHPLVTTTGPIIVTANTGAYAVFNRPGPNFTYVAPGDINSYTPDSGQFGTRITLGGTKFFGANPGTSVTSVFVDGVRHHAIVSQSATNVVFRPALGTANNAADIIIESNNGARTVLRGGFNKLADGAIVSISPKSAQTGRTVTISGTNLIGYGSSIFRLLAAGVDVTSNIVAESPTQVTFQVPSASGSGQISIEADTGSLVNSGNSLLFTFASIATVTPNSGQVGTRVTIRGVGLDSGDTNVTSVTLAGTAATILSRNDTVVVVQAGARAAGTGHVVLTSQLGFTVSQNNGFTYTAVPSITSTSPSSGQIGTRVTIEGTNLLGGGSTIQSVLLRNRPAVVSSSNDTYVVAVAASSPAGLGNVVLISDSGSSVTDPNAFRYITPGDILSVDPASGQVGTQIVIRGTGLFGGGSSITDVTLLGTSATILSANATTVIVRAAARSNGTGDVIITADTGATTTETNGFEYRIEGQIASVSPSDGTFGTRVTLSGTNLFGHGANVSTVTIGGTAAQVENSNNTYIVVRAGYKVGPNANQNIIITSDTGATVTQLNGWAYRAAAAISTVTPNTGAGGTLVTIAGSNLLAYGTQVTSVKLAGITAASIVSASNTEVIVAAGASLVGGVGNVEIEANTGGIAQGSNLFTYVSKPEVSAVSPALGITGSQVTLAGINFFGGGTRVTSVVMAGVPVSQITVNNNNLLVVILGPNPDPVNGASGDITITSDNGATFTETNRFQYQPDGDITTLTPSSGQGGTVITVRGAQLQGNPPATIEYAFLNNVRAAIRFQNQTSVVLVAGASSISGVGDLVFQVASKATITKANAFTYIDPGTIFSVTPSSGQDGTVVTLAGNNLLAGGSSLTSVRFGSTPVKSVESANDTHVIATIDNAPATGPVDIVLTADTEATVVRRSAWRYLTKGSIATVTPNQGQYGTQVTITGTGLRAGGTKVRTVRFGSVEHFRIVSENDTVVIVRAGDNLGNLSVGTTVTVVADTSASLTKLNAFTYVAAGSISGVVPSQGQTSTRVTISGTNLLGGGSSVFQVLLANISATVESASNTEIFVRAGDNGATAALGDVEVISDTRAIVASTGSWTYVPSGTIVSVSPSRGQRGTLVTISGTDLLGGGSSVVQVSFAGEIATSFVSANNTHIILAAPASSVAKTGNVTITTDTGATVRAANNAWQYLAPQVISSVSPAVGVKGTRITITGTGLRGGGNVITQALFDSIPVTVLSGGSDTSVIIVADQVPADLYDITLRADTGAFVVGTDRFTYGPDGVISSLSPAFGQFGTRVTISGTNLRGQGAQVIKVYFGSVLADSLVSQTNTQVVIIAGNGPASGPVNVTIENNVGGLVELANAWAFTDEGVINSVDPIQGQFGTRVTITGTYLLGNGTAVASVTVAGIPVASVISATSEEIIVELGQKASPGSGAIVITSDTGAIVSQANAFTYTVASAISNVSPNRGQIGTRITITGTNLYGGGTSIVSVLLKTAPVLSIESHTPTSVVVRAAAPPSLGLGDVVVIADTGAKAARINHFTYETPSTINTVTPSVGQVGTIVTIAGTNLLGLTGGTSIVSVKLVNVDATISSSNATHVIAVAAASPATSGSVTITANSGALATKASSFTYAPPGNITDLLPPAGVSGTFVTIVGTDLLGGAPSAATVLVAGVSAQIVFSNNTHISVRLAASGPRTGIVRIVSSSGSIVESESNFTYLGSSSIASVSPSAAQPGARVTITGASLRAGSASVTQVSLAGIIASITSENDTHVIVVAGPNPGGNQIIGDVVVTASNGGTTVKVNGFTYQPSGAINTITPASGQEGTFVRIVGTDIPAGGSEVVRATLVGIDAVIVNQSATHILLRAGAGPSVNTTGNVVLVSNTGSSITRTNAFSYLVPGTILAVDPVQGQAGVDVRISGINLCGAGSTGVASVTLVGVNAPVLSLTNCALLVVDAGEKIVSSDTTGDVVITGNSGSTVRLVDGFTYVRPAVINSVTPSAGQGGHTVTIVGDGMFGGGSSAVSVEFGSVPALILFQNSSFIRARVGSGPVNDAVRTVSVVITSNTGVVVTKTNAWSYTVIDAVEPSSGQVGTVVTITGTGLTGGNSVRFVNFAGIRASSIVSSNDTHVIAVAASNPVTQDQAGLITLTLLDGRTITSVSGTAGDNQVTFTYKIPGQVTSVSPRVGKDGTTITIVGTNLLGYGSRIVTARLATSDATVEGSNNTAVVITAGFYGNPGLVPLTLIADTGATTTYANAFQYVVAPNITSVDPAYGQGGTRVTVTGSVLLSGDIELQSATIAGVAAQIQSATNTEVILRAGHRPSPAVGDVVLTAKNGASVTSVGGFEYKTPGAVSSVSPVSGHGGTYVTITGTGLRGWGSSVTQVTLNGVVAGILSENDTHVIVRAAAASAGSGDVVLTADSGAEVRRVSGWTYIVPGAISSVTPNNGQLGTVVTIAGTNLLGGGSSVSSVTLNGQAVDSIVSGTNIRVVVVAAAGSAGSGAVVIESDTGAQVSRASSWTQLDEGTISSVSPDSGQLNTVVTINGLRLLGGGSDLASVTLSGVPASYTAGTATNTRVVVVAGSGSAGAAGTVRLVADTGAIVSRASAFRYVTAGAILSVTPGRGQAGTRVVIEGTDMLGGGSSVASVTLAGVSVRSIVSGNDTMVVVVAAGRAGAIVGNVVVTADTGATTTAVNGFEYLAVPVINTVSPGSGQAGTRVTISGSNMLVGGSPVASVTLAGEAVSSVVSESSTSIVVVAAAASAKTGDVVVTLASGSEVIKTGAWEYLQAGVIDSLTPTSGQRGSRVVIAGARLLGGGASITGVTLAGTAVETIVSSNNTHVVVVAAQGSSAVLGHVVLTANTGAVVSRSDAWTYLAPGSISQVVPAFGQEGTRVVISGSRLIGDGSTAALVTLAGVSATVTGASQTQVNVTAASSAARVGDVVVVSDTGIMVTASNGWEYREAGFIAAVEPSSGVEGTQVLLYGSNLFGHGSGVASLTLAGQPATISQQTNFFVRAAAGAGSAGAPGAAVLVSLSGAVVTKANAWRYVSRGDITTVTPARGSPGTRVVIEGTSLLSGGSGVTQVTLAGVVAVVLSANDTHVIVEANAPRGSNAIVGDVVITSSNGAVTSKVAAWTYVAASEIQTVSPSSGQYGTVVTMTGVSLLAGGSSVSVTLAGIPVQSVVSQSDSEVVVVAAPATSRTGDIVLQANTGGSVVRRNGWTYVAVPVVASVLPTAGQVGTRVTVSGTGLLGGGSRIATASLAGQAVAQVVSSNNSMVVLVAASNGSLSSGDVVLVADTGAIISRSNSWTYLAASEIASVQPSAGQRGTFVMIQGSNLLGGGSSIVSVTLASVSASLVSANNTHVRVRANTGAAGTGHIVLTADTGATTTRENGWTYNAAGVVSSVSPNRGQLDTLVTVSGTALLGGGSALSAASLKGISAAIVSASDSSVVLRAASGSAGVGDVQLESDTGAIVVGGNLWTQLADGVISSVAPGSGQFGTRVTISGTSLLGGSSSLVSVSLSGVFASIISATDSSIVVIANASVASVGDVRLVADTGAVVVRANGWTYVSPAAISGLNPPRGQVGTRVTISGSGLLGGGVSVQSVRLADVPVQSIVSASSSAIVVVAADGSPQVGDVVIVSNTGATVSSVNAWTYDAVGVIGSVSPSSGQVGTLVTISGVNIVGGGSQIVFASLGGAHATVSFSNNSVAVVSAAQRSAGVVDVVLASDTGATVRLANSFTYLVEGVISSVIPNEGQLGTLVEIRGQRLLGGGSSLLSVTFKGIAQTDIASSNDTYIRLSAVASGSLGFGDVVITSDSGSVVTRVNGWKYNTPSSISTVSPSNGQLGTRVTISGSNLLGVSGGSRIVEVTLGGRSATIVSGTSQSQVVVSAGAGGLGLGDVVVVADSGARAVKANAWTYNTGGDITSVSPSSGQVGTLVTIDGSALLGGGSSVFKVFLNGVEVSSVRSSSATRIVVVAARGSAGTGDVVIVSDTGSEVRKVNGWEYQVEGLITTVTPSSGQRGTRVTISGSSLRGYGASIVSVLLVGTSVSSIESETNSEVVVIASNAPAATGDVVLVADTGAITTKTNGFTYLAIGVVNTVVPASGHGGTRVTLLGTSLRGGGSEVVNVTLAGRDASILRENDTAVIVAAGDGPENPATGDVVLRANTGAVITRVNGFSYITAGLILSVSPDVGGAGAIITITGTLCGGGSSIVSVTLVGQTADIQAGATCSVVKVRARDYGAAVTGEVVVTSNTGSQVKKADAFSYLAVGEITSVRPNAGQQGTSVTIEGVRLLGGGSTASRVSLAGVDTFVQFSNDSYIVLLTLAGTGRGDVVITSNIGVVTRLVNGWTYSTVNSVSPAFGQRGTIITIQGLALLAGGSSIQSLELTGVTVTNILSVSNTSIVAVAPERTVAVDTTGDVRIVVDNGQTVVGTNKFTYKRAGAINVVTPASGQFGTRVTIVGDRLFGHGVTLSSVTLANVAVKEIVSANNSVVVVIANASVATTGDIVLTSNTGSTVILADGLAVNNLPGGVWRYVAPAVITNVQPATGQKDTRVTITGTGLFGGGSGISSVVLAGVETTRVVSATETEVVVSAEASLPTAVGDVMVIANTGATTLTAGAFRYVTEGTIQSVLPNSGQIGTLVTIQGTRLRGDGSAVVQVSLKGVQAQLVSENDTFVTVVANSGSAGVGNVVLTSSSGATVTRANGWTYIVPGSIATVVPSDGQRGTRVTISGSALLGGGSSVARVRLAGTDVSSVSSSSDSAIVVVAASAAAGTGDVIVVADTGALTTKSNGWTYLPEGSISTVRPNSGQVGTLVEIRGTRLLGNGNSLVSVSFGSVPTTIESANNTHVYVRVGAGGVAESRVDIVMTADTGALITQVNGWTVASSAQISRLTPSSGQFGTLVNITGVNILAGGTRIVAVKLDGVDVSEIVVSNQPDFVVVRAGAKASASVGNVEIVADNGAITTLAGGWRYLTPGSISQVSPGMGQFGTHASIFGTNLLGGGTRHVSVKLKGVPVQQILFSSNTRVDVVADAGTAGPGSVVLEADTGATVEAPCDA